MSLLNYIAICSVDGYIEDPDGDFGFAMPSDEVHQFVNDLERETGTYLYGRRTYEVMTPWENEPSLADGPIGADFAAIWQATDKVVYSRTLTEPATKRTRIETEFDAEAVRRMKEEADRDMAIGGPGIAAHAFRAGLVDVINLFVVPWIVGGGKPALPDGVRAELELLEQRRFENGTVHLRYRAGW